jgi:K(+)-stimulated pyrophosphate-energized sodium pump
MADLDAVGNTTKAITKGVAIGSAVIAAVSLFGSFLVDVSRAQSGMGIAVADQIQSIGIRVDIPQIFVGMLIGGALPWLFSSFAIQAVNRAASLFAVNSNWVCWKVKSNLTTPKPYLFPPLLHRRNWFPLPCSVL